MIHQFEGDAGQPRTRRAQDPAGNWEIGWGHKLTGPDDPLWDRILGTLQECDALAIQDLTVFAGHVCATLGSAVTDLTDGQYAALIDFTYNEGPGAFAGSTLARLVRQGNLTLAPGEFQKWVYATVDGKLVKLDGLVRRRAAELYAWQH